MYLIDTHAHIYLPEFEDKQSLLQAAMDKEVHSILLPAIDSSTHAYMLQTEAQFQSCYAMMGLHPCSVKEEWKDELEIAATYLEQRKFIAIGEIGLDFYWDKTFVKQQYEAFHKQIELAMVYNIPIAIHSRNATEECIEVVKQYPGLTGVFHCFSGSTEQAYAVIAQNFMLGIGGVVTFKNSGLDKVVAAIGLDHVVLETDAPYLAPVPYRGKRNESSYLPLIAQKISSLVNIPVEVVAAITTANARKLFHLPQ